MVDRQGDPKRSQESQHQQSGQQRGQQTPPQQTPPQQGQPQQQGRQQQGGQPSGMTSRKPPQQPQQRGQQQPKQQGQQPRGPPQQQSQQQGPPGQQQGMSQQPSSQSIRQQPSRQQAQQQPPQPGATTSQAGQQGQQPGQQMQQSGGGMQQPGQQTQQPSQRMQQPGQQMQLGGTTGGRQGTGRPEIQPVPLDEVIQTDVVTVTEDTEITDIIKRMDEQDVGSAVVVDDQESPLGIVTDRKIALSMQESPDITDRTAQEFTQDEVVTADTEMNIYDAINELSQESIRRLPIVDEDGTLVGIVTLDDILVLLSMELDTAADVIESQSPRL